MKIYLLGDDFKPDSSDYDDDDSVSSGVDENGCSETEESEPESPVKVKRCLFVCFCNRGNIDYDCYNVIKNV